MSTVSDITTFQDTTFAALRTSYPTWDLLSAYLKTELGLVVRTVDAHYALIHYDKTKSRMSHSLVRTFRSVVWDTEKNLPVSVTPPKSVDGEQVPAFSDPSEVDSYTVSEFYDGTLIGAFRCKYDNKVILHTRTHMPANNIYYGKKTFASMVEEAVSMDILDARIENGSCYAYVLQHPENRIVVPTIRPVLKLVQTATISEDGTLEIPQPPSDHVPLTTSLPTAYEVWRTEGEVGLKRALLAKMVGITATMPFQGVVVLDKHTNTRYKIRTSHYNAIRQMRGDTANLEYVWLNHWKVDKLTEYLRIYPEEKTAANALLEQWKRCSNEIFGFYKDVFIFHTIQLNQVPRKYRPLLHEMQEMYKTVLKPQGRRMTWYDIRTFLNNQDVPRILFVLHYKDIPSSAVSQRSTVEVTASGGFNIRSGDYLPTPTPTPVTSFPSPTPITSYAAIARRGIEEFPASNAGLAVEMTHNDFD